VGLLYRSQPAKSHIAQINVPQEADRADAISAVPQAPPSLDQKQAATSAAASGKKAEGSSGELKQIPRPQPAETVGALAENKVAEKAQAFAKRMDHANSAQKVEMTAGTVSPATVPSENEVADLVPGRAKDALQERDQATVGGVNAPMAKMRMAP